MTFVAIIEPNRMTRLGIEHVIAECPGLTVVAAVPTIGDFAGGQADVIVLSPLAGGTGHDAITALSAIAPVLVMSAAPGRAERLAALRAGATGFVTPDVDKPELLAAIDAVARGAFYVQAGLALALHGELGSAPAGEDKGLARREIETLCLVARGLTHRQIARRMGLTEATVNTYVKRIRAKLNAGNKAELTRRAIELGYVPGSEGTGPADSSAVTSSMSVSA